MANFEDPPVELDDAALLERWRAKDMAAGQQLFARHFSRVERYFINKVSTEHVADLVQETFVACVEARDRILEGARFRSYLLGVAHNVLCGHLRRKYANATVDVLDQSIAELSGSPSSVLARHEEQQILLEALRSLSIRYQAVLELYYWEDMRTDGIAEVMGVPPATARTWLSRARQDLEAALGKFSRSREALESTMTRLDDWASSCLREAARPPNRT
ncbi:RNA polymerase sigma factor [Nannocystaceae bacterium ST9]